MKLNKEQYRAAVHVNGPMLVLAGPGSGKTHLLVERIRMMIQESGIPPANILVITFSQKAARQMQARFEKRVETNSLPVTFGTFHAVFYHILKVHDPTISNLITEEEQQRFIKEAIELCKPESDIFSYEDVSEHILGMISAYKNFGEEFHTRSEYGRKMTEQERSEFDRIYDSYTDLCHRAGLIDFDDMVLKCGKLLYKHESILRKWQNKYRYILVDEFQDINDMQYRVLRLLAGDEQNVFAVGDDDQSIYAFRGARPDLMKKFLYQYKGCRQVTLTMNYRCCENVIGAADTVIRHNVDRLVRPMQRHLPSKSGGIVEIINSENTIVQAAFVCDMIEKLKGECGYSANDFAVLYRSGHCASMFEKVAQDRGLSLRLNSDTGQKSLQQKIHEAYIRAHEMRASRADYFLIINNPKRGLSREALCIDTGNYIEDLKSYYKDEPDRLEKVYELERMIRDYGGSYDYSKTKEPSPCRDGVNVMTAHASKGLEFACVFIIGLQEGLFPHYKNMTENVEEERRLMYVAMTRAKERLYMCSVSTDYGKRASRFVGEAKEKTKYIKDCKRLFRV